MKYKKTTLKNGLRILTIPMKETQTVTILVMVGVGSRYESEKEAGISHFIEHMFFKGTLKRPTALDISSELDAIGGESNAFTGKDSTGYYVKVDASHLDKALDVVADIYLNSKIEEAEIEKERGAILQEFAMVEDSPIRQVGDVLEEVLYEGNPLGRYIQGKKEAVRKLKRKDLALYRDRFYLANDTVISVAGNFNPQETIGKISRYFSSMKKGGKPGYPKVKDKQPVARCRLKLKKTDQTHFILGNRAFHENHPDRFALAVLSVILGGNMSSRLFVEVREKRGLAYYVRTGVEAFNDCGYIATQAGVEHKNLPLALRTIMDEYKKVIDEKVDEKEIRKAKDFIKGRTIMGMESSDEVASFYIEQELKRKKVLDMKEMLRRFEMVTADDIQRVARKIFRSDNLNLAVIGPHRNAQKLQKLLKI